MWNCAIFLTFSFFVVLKKIFTRERGCWFVTIATRLFCKSLVTRYLSVETILLNPFVKRLWLFSRTLVMSRQQVCKALIDLISSKYSFFLCSCTYAWHLVFYAYVYRWCIVCDNDNCSFRNKYLLPTYRWDLYCYKLTQRTFYKEFQNLIWCQNIGLWWLFFFCQ